MTAYMKAKNRIYKMREERRLAQATYPPAVPVAAVEVLLARSVPAPVPSLNPADRAPHRSGPRRPSDLTAAQIELRETCVRYAGRIGRSRSEREEFAQDAFVHVFELHRENPDRPWPFYQKAIWRKCLDLKRKAVRETPFSVLGMVAA